jgi:hypothetical protein
MKSFLRAAAATGVAAATLAAGLSFGPAATADTPRAEVETGEPIQLIGQFKDSPWFTALTRTKWGSAASSFSTLADAKQQAATMLPVRGPDAADGTPQWMLASRATPDLSGYFDCMQQQVFSNSTTHYLGDKGSSCKVGEARADQLFSFEDGEWKAGDSVVLPRRVSGKAGPDDWSGLEVGSKSGNSYQWSENVAPRPLTATVADVALEAGTANLVDGVAPKNATAVEVSYTDKDGKKKVRNATVTDGKWSQPLTALALGKTTVHLTAFDGVENIAESDVEVDLPVTPLTARGEFSTEHVEEVATVVGTATNDTTINAYAGDKKVATTMSGPEGDFELAINPPNKAGEYPLRVTQQIRDEDATPQDVELDYGTGVTITNPQPDTEYEAGDPVIISGEAQRGSIVKVYEKGNPRVVLGQMTATNGYRIVLDDLEDREYDLVVAGISKGNNRTTSEVTINPGKNSVVSPTAAVEFDQDVAKHAVVKGTGAEDATITVKNGSTVVGTATVEDGTWSTEIDPLGAGSHTLTIEQTGIEGTQTVETTADFGAAVSLNGPEEFANGELTVTGTSSQGAQVTVTTGGRTVDTFTVTNEDGTFSRDLTGVGSGTIELQATAKSKGALTTDTTSTSTAPITAESVQLASHIKNGTFVPGEQHFVGRGTVGATITLNPFGFDPKYTKYDLTTTVDQFGEWAIDRGLSDTPYAMLAFKQTPQGGVTNEVTNYNLKPYREVGEPGDLQLTNFKAGDFFNPGDQVFSGKATPGATVTLNPFGFDPRYADYDLTTTAHPTTGAWEIRRGLANTVYRELAVKQDPATDGKVNKIEHVTVAANGWVGAPANLVLKTPGNTFTPGEQTFSGTATAGTTVTLYPFGDDKYAEIKMTTKVDATGKWEIKRNLGNQVFPTVITQTEQDGKVNRVTHTMTPAS